MDENPYKAPQEPSGAPQPSKFWKQFADLLLLLVVGTLCSLVLWVLLAIALGPRIN